MLTQGVRALVETGHGLHTLMQCLADFDEFTQDNDPYGEHDFGAFTFTGVKLFWKIDYYDSSLKYLSVDPANPAKTRRVLTLMLSEEYWYV